MVKMFRFCAKISRNLPNKSVCCKFSHSSICAPPPEEPVVTLLDANSEVGLNLALLLKQNPLIKELRLFDEEKGTLELAQDLKYLDTRTKIRPFCTKSLKKAIQGAHLVISTGGCPFKPGLSQKELFETNLDNVRNAAIFLAEFNPAAIYCIAKPPVEALVPLVAEEYKKAETYDPRKIIGVTTHISMVANTFIAKHANRDPALVYCPVIGGMSPQGTIPVVSQIRPTIDMGGDVFSKLRIAVATAEENLLKKGGMSCFSKATAISRFINLVLKALKGNANCVECAFVPQIGHIKDFLPYMTSIVKLGPQGVASTHMPRLNDTEVNYLKAAKRHIMQNILLGKNFLQGDFPSSLKRKPKEEEDFPPPEPCKTELDLECPVK